MQTRFRFGSAGTMVVLCRGCVFDRFEVTQYIEFAAASVVVGRAADVHSVLC